jgi:hypothetical protein
MTTVVDKSLIDIIIHDKSFYDYHVGFLWKYLNETDGGRESINEIRKSIKEIFKHQVNTNYAESLDSLTYSKWCNENIQNAWSRWGNIFYFEDKSDATLFKLFFL